MKTKALIKSQCERCGKVIYTTPITATVHRHTYRKYGRVCSECLTDEEKRELSLSQVEETALAAIKYRIIQKIEWGTIVFDNDEEQIIKYIASRIYYTKLYPSYADIMNEFPDMDVKTGLQNLEARGIIQSLF